MAAAAREELGVQVDRRFVRVGHQVLIAHLVGGRFRVSVGVGRSGLGLVQVKVRVRVRVRVRVVLIAHHGSEGAPWAVCRAGGRQ